MENNEKNYGRLTRETIYVMGVTHVHENRRSFNRGNDKYYTHDVYLTDRDGNDYRGEYCTQSMTQAVFIPGKQTRFKCIFVSDRGYEITPWTEEIPKNVPTELLGVSETMVAGESYTIALGYATEIMVAKIQSTGCQVDDAFQEMYLILSDKLNHYLLSKAQEYK
jgi:hypothetical protein